MEVGNVKKAYIMEKRIHWVEYELLHCRPCMDYIPTKIRKLLGTKAKLNWQVHVLAGDRDEEDGMGWSDERPKTIDPSSRTFWRRIKDGMGWSDERSWNNSPSSRTLWRRMTRTGYRIIKGEILNSWSSSRTLWRQMKRMWCDDQIREILNQLTKFTYSLETNEKDGMEW